MIIQVIGLGLIGGSLCKTIKKRTSHTVWGMDRDPAAVQKAQAAAAIDAAGTTETLSEADLSIVCLYPEGTVSFLLEHRNHFRKGGLVIDVCGVKGAVISAAAGPLRDSGVRFVGCHPMAGREFSGFAYARDDLFDGASFILTPVEETDPAAVEEVRSFARSLGFGKTVLSTPEEHDRIIAATSQLAHVVSNAYIKSPTLRHQAGFSAGSYQDLTRVAKLSEEMWTSLFLLNREALLYEVDTIIGSLAQYRDALDAGDAAGLKALLREGRELKEEDLERTAARNQPPANPQAG
ncbi:MAG: prephenate dehydrogenase [Candidatus Merdivicinus sp.]|jgi:prephenate dehydrogenase